MVETHFSRFVLKQLPLDVIQDAISNRRTSWAPVAGEDGLCRLQPTRDWPALALAQPTLIPLKKLFLPHRESLWVYRNNRFLPAQSALPVAVIGVPLCDLQALWYLDQVFADDTTYQNRRANSFVVGLPCEPKAECRCDSQLMPIAGDLFIDSEELWALSPAGESLLSACGCTSVGKQPLPWPPDTAQRPKITAEQFTSAASSQLWSEAAKRCLSCGACSAVCPTCYCFDMLDHADLDGSVTRRRTWDNCFFAEHGKIAGGIDFRPERAARLRFRTEHKFFSFGPLRGQNSCVGCGRCRKVCPVDIDLDQIASQLGVEDAG